MATEVDLGGQLSNVSSVAKDTTALVESKFASARDYASQAWSAAQTALSNLSTLAKFSPDIDAGIGSPRVNYSKSIITNLVGSKPDIPSINYTLPSSPTVDSLEQLPSFSYLVGEIDDLREAFLDKLLAMLTDGVTGLDATVEALIWARARQRQEVQNLAQYTEAEQFFSSRGFILPPGVLVGRLQEITLEIERNNANLNNDITVEQARLAQTNTNFMLEKGSLIVLENMKASIDSVLKYNEGIIQQFTAKVEEYKQNVMVIIAKIEAEAKIYSAEADVYKALAALASDDIQAQRSMNELELKWLEAEANLRLKAAEALLSEAVRVFGLQLEAAKAAATVSGQVAASAMSSVNASASLGMSGGASVSGQIGVSSTYSSSISEETRHTYEESV